MVCSLMLRRLTFAATLLTVLGWAATASASPTARLVYVRGEGADACPNEVEMRRAVATRLGYDPFRPIAATTLTAEITRDKGVFRGRVRLVDDAGVERGARDLESRADDCRDLTTAMALSMSIAIDPLSMTRPSRPEPEEAGPAVVEPAIPETPPEPPPATVVAPASPNRGDAAARPPEDRTSMPDPPRFTLGAGGHVAAGIAPAASVGLRVSTELLSSRWSVGLEGRFDFPASAPSSEGGRSKTSLAGGALVPCLKVPLVWACAVLLLAQVDAAAVEISAPRSEAFFFLGAGIRLQGAIELPEGFRLRIGGDVLAQPTPFELTLNTRRVHRNSDVSAAFGIALVRIF